MSKGSPTAPRWNEQIHDKARLYRYFCLQGQLSRDADAQNQTGLKNYAKGFRVVHDNIQRPSA
eukprot:236520-Pelagomonas_calceolata.AAC.1